MGTNNFEYCQEVGNVMQDIVMEQLFRIGISCNIYTSKRFQFNKGESLCGIEIKHDSKFRQTRKLYFEFSAINKANTNMVDNGIMKQDNAWLYIIGDEQECFIFAKNQLKLLYGKVVKNPKAWQEKYDITLSSHYDGDKISSSGMCIPIKYVVEQRLAINHLRYEGQYDFKN